MFDAHVHLDFLKSPAAVAEYVRRARGAGVFGFAIPGVSAAQWPVAKRIAERIGDAVWGCGVHPEHASSDSNEASKLVHFASEQQPDFIGETGLDARLESVFSKEAQEELFAAHIDLAEALGRPLVVHSVRRHARVLELLKGRDVRGMVHGFIGSAEVAAGYLERGWLLSVGKGAIQSPKTERALASAPLDRILVESDEPGDENDVPGIVDWLSELRGAPLQRVAKQTHANALDLFVVGDPRVGATGL